MQRQRVLIVQVRTTVTSKLVPTLQSLYLTSFFPMLFAVVNSVLRLSGQEYTSQLMMSTFVWLVTQSIFQLTRMVQLIVEVLGILYQASRHTLFSSPPIVGLW